MTNRAPLRIVCLIGALACLAGAAWLAFDWADYGPDGTCGNFIRYKGAGGTCADMIRSRVSGFVGLVVGAVALLAVVWIVRPPRSAQSN